MTCCQQRLTMAASLRVLTPSSRKPLRAERRFRELLEAAPDAILEVDSDGIIVLLNGMTEKLFGYDRVELLGQPVQVLMPEDLREAQPQKRNPYWAQALACPP